VALLACAALAYVAAPVRARDDDESPEPGEVAEVAGRKRAALVAILDMEDERDAGKLSESDFAGLRREYESEAAAALAELDALGASSGAADDALEAEISAMRTRLQRDPRRHARTAALEPCPSCGTPRAPGRACERCGR
jgi:ribosomal protein L32